MSINKTREEVSNYPIKKDKYPEIRQILDRCIGSWIKITEENYQCRNCKPNKYSRDCAENYDYYIDIENEIEELINNKDKLVYIGKDNFPVEGIIGKSIITFIRRLIHTRKICRYSTWRKNGGCKIKF